MTMRRLTTFIVAVTFAGCIGTDLVDIPLGPQGSQAVIDEDELSLLVGQEHLLNFKLLATDGSEINANWDWFSQELTVASVDLIGNVTANGTGQAWIFGTANGEFTDSVLVTVLNNPNEIASVTIQGSEDPIEVGQTVQLEAIVRNLDGDIISTGVSWSSSDEQVAAVNQTGLVSAISDGTTEIVASAEGINSVPFPITVGSDAGDTRTGTFSGRNGYNAEGTAVLNLGSDRSLEFLSDFKTQSGPGLYIYLSPNASNVDGALNLGEIVATTGAQSYEISPAANLDGLDHVIIYCKPFGVLFGIATLEE